MKKIRPDAWCIGAEGLLHQHAKFACYSLFKLSLSKIRYMSKFYVLMLALLVIAIINLVRALKEKKSKGKFWGVTINIVGIILLVVAIVLSFLQ